MKFLGLVYQETATTKIKLFGKRKRMDNTPQNIFAQFEKVVTIKYLSEEDRSYSG